MTKFKPGDRVRISPYAILGAGMTGTVTRGDQWVADVTIDQPFPSYGIQAGESLTFGNTQLLALPETPA
ncbi:MAG: hypothetical protein ACREEP_11380 [Dongiaceae bacterium]